MRWLGKGRYRAVIDTTAKRLKNLKDTSIAELEKFSFLLRWDTKTPHFPRGTPFLSIGREARRTRLLVWILSRSGPI